MGSSGLFTRLQKWKEIQQDNIIIAKRGTLSKQSKYLKEWRQRTVIIANGHLMSFDEESTPTAIISILQITNLVKQQQEGYFLLKIHSKNQPPLHFKTNEEYDRDEWFSTLSMTILRRILETATYQRKPIKSVENFSSLLSSRLFVSKKSTNMYNLFIIMMVDYPAVKQLLLDIENPSKAKYVAEDIERHTQDPHFVSLLQVAIRDKQLPFNTQLAGAVVLSRVLSEMYFKWDEEILAQTLVGLIADMQVENRIKETLQLNLTSVLEISSPKLFQKLVMKAAELIIMGRQQGPMQVQFQNTEVYTNKVKSGTLILRCLVNSQAHFSILAKAIVEQFLQSTVASIKGFSVKQINTLIGIIQFWKEVFQKSRNGATKDHTQLLRLLSRSQLLSQWIFYLYQHDHLAGQQCFINPQSSSDHEHITKLKMVAADLHKQILIGLELTQSINPEITNRHLSQINGIINTICVFISYQKLCEAYEPFIIELIGITILSVKLFRSSYEENYHRMLHIVAFPLLSISEEEQQLFADDPAEFNNLAEDCCDKQSYGILKTEAAKLLQTVCDDINMAATYTIQHALISLKIRLSIDQNITQNVQNFLSIQQAFTILTILSYRIGKHELQLKQLRNILIAENVMKKVNPLELTRIFQFLAYNYQEVYPHYSLGENWMKMALNLSIEEAETYPSLAYSALDFISNVLQNCFVESVAMQYIQQNYNYKNFDIRYKILLKIMGKYFMNFSPQGLALALEKLLQAVLIDIQNYQNDKKSHTMDITQSLHICRRIAEKPDFIGNNSPVKKKIWEFISHLQLFRKINLDDQIVKIVASFIRCEGLTPQIQQILPKFLSLFRIDYSQTAYIIFFNQVALRVADPEGFGVLYPLLQAVTHLHSNILERPTSMSDNLALGTVLLVLQHIVSIFGDRMNPQSIVEIVQAANLILPISDQPEDKTEAIIIARALNLLFICHMHHRDERALRKLLQFSDALLFRGHDLKVLTICLTKELFRQADIVSVTQMIIYLVNSIWKARDQPPEIKSKKNPRVQIKSTVIKIHKVANYQVCLKSMLHPFKDPLIPEFQLRQALSKMRNNNDYLYQSMMKTLPSKVSERLRQLVSEVTIEGRRRKIFKIGDEKINPINKFSINAAKKRDFSSSDDQGEQMNEDEGPSNRKGMMKKKRKEEQKSHSNE